MRHICRKCNIIYFYVQKFNSLIFKKLNTILLLFDMPFKFLLCTSMLYHDFNSNVCFYMFSLFKDIGLQL